MCGICGMFDMQDRHRTDAPTLYSMIESLRHRGPDGMDHYFHDNAALGFSRLSIIDLEHGMQPLSNEDGSLVLICNGEIYNHQGLRDKLMKKGHRFKTACDVEVILHLYEEYGMEFLEQLNGQFAFVLYEPKEKRIFCVRDQVGIAPFFYTITDGLFLFGSEIKAILRHPAVGKAVDLTGLDQVFTFPGPVSPKTLFRNINSLESGHYLMVDANRGCRDVEYWDLIYPLEKDQSPEQEESYYIDRLDEVLSQSVKYRLQADVPIGFYLSGGLDSSLIAAKVKQLDQGRAQHSFSIDVSSEALTEVSYQRLMASQLKTRHHENSFGAENILKNLRRAVYHSESALRESYNTASLALSYQALQAGTKVILTGEGADELFGGYVGYRFDKMRRMNPSSRADNDEERTLREQLWGDADLLYERDYGAYSLEKKKIYSNYINDIFHQVDCLSRPLIDHCKIKGRHPFHQRSYIDFKLRMTDHLLSDHGDRMAYANSIEARYPFLDPKLIDFAREIPVDLKLHGFEEKYILKRVAERYVPEEIVNRPKFAFVAPGSSELLQHGSEYIEDMLSYERIKRQGYFNPERVEFLRKQYSQNGFRLNVPYDNDYLMTVLTMNILLDIFQLPSA